MRFYVWSKRDFAGKNVQTPFQHCDYREIYLINTQNVWHTLSNSMFLSIISIHLHRRVKYWVFGPTMDMSPSWHHRLTNRARWTVFICFAFQGWQKGAKEGGLRIYSEDPILFFRKLLFKTKADTWVTDYKMRLKALLQIF